MTQFPYGGDWAGEAHTPVDGMQAARIVNRVTMAGWALLALGIVLLAVIDLMPHDRWWPLLSWCAIAAAILVPTLQSAAANWRAWLMEPIATLAIAFLVYYVVGAAVFAYYDEHPLVIARMDVTEATYPRLLRSCAACSIGFGIAVLGYRVAVWFPGSALLKRSCAVLLGCSRPNCARAFLVVGGLGQLAVFLLWALELTSPVLQTVSLASQLALAGIVLAMWDRPVKLVPFTALAAVGVALFSASAGVLYLSKQAVAKPIMAIVLGLGLRGSGVLRGLVLVSIPMTVAIGLGTFVSSARLESRAAGDSPASAIDGITEVVSGGAQASSLPLARLHYTSTQAAIMRLYDEGERGQDIAMIPWLLVPRALAPQKPVISSSGARIHEVITGQIGSSDSPGTFVEGYFNLGWPGLVIAALLTGIVLGQFALICRRLPAEHCWLLFPVVLLGHFVAVRIDGHVLSDVIAPWIYLWVLLGLLLFVSSLVRTTTKVSHG